MLPNRLRGTLKWLPEFSLAAHWDQHFQVNDRFQRNSPTMESMITLCGDHGHCRTSIDGPKVIGAFSTIKSSNKCLLNTMCRTQLCFCHNREENTSYLQLLSENLLQTQHLKAPLKFPAGHMDNCCQVKQLVHFHAQRSSGTVIAGLD